MIEQPNIPVENCTSRTRCFYCWKFTQTISVAAVRAFAGTYGGGFPACAAHASLAITEAMATFASKGIDPDTWRVSAYTVVDDGHGYPRMGRQLFTARLKQAH